MDPNDYLAKRYEAETGYWSVIGYIDKPALVLRNPVTGDKEVWVIGSPNHHTQSEIDDAEALRRAEHHLFTGATATS